jgi:ferric-dicitrate binding protein FerR (iron transport regulator)
LDELSRRLGTTPATIGAWRSGDVHMPDREFAVLVELLGDLEPGWLSRERKP